MGTFLQIVLAVFLVIVVLIAGAFLYIRSRFKQAVGNYSAATEILGEFTMKPSRIQLRRGENFGNSKAFDELAEQLQKLGFQRICDLEELNGAYQAFLAMGHRELPVAAAVSEDFAGNAGFTVFSMDQDRQVIGRGNDSSCPVVAGKVDWRADTDLTPDGALEEVRSHMAEGNLRFDLKLFRAVFEQVYALHMDQEIVHEPTIETVRKMAADAGKEATEEEIETAHNMVLDNWKMQIEDAVLDRYRRTSKIDAVEWEELQGEIQIVHNRLTEHDIASLVAYDDVSDKVFEQCVAQGLTGVELYEAINGRLPTDRQMKKLGEIERPIRTILYVPNEDIQSDVQPSRRYVYEANDPEGKAVQGSVFATGSGDAKAQLADLGLMDVKILIEPVPATGGEDFDELLLDDKSAEMAARSTKQGIFAALMSAVVSNWWIWAPPTGLVAKTFFDGPPFGWGDYLGFAYAALALAALVFLLGPMFFYNQLLVAQLKAKPRLARFWIALLGMTGRFAGITSGQLTIERCKSLAEEDKLEEALEAINAIRNEITEEEYQAGLTSIYSTAGEWSSMMDAQRAYLQESPAKETATVDLALSVARYNDDVEQAEPLIQSIRPSDLPEVGLIGYQYVRGLIAAHRGQHQQALRHYAQAVETARQFETLPIMIGMIAEINGHAALAYKRSGDAANAEKLWKQNFPIIRPHRSSERLIKAYEAEKSQDE